MKNSLRTAALFGFLMAAIIGPGGAGTAAAAEVNFRLHHFLPPVSSTHANFLAPWAERVEAASDGRIAIEISPAMGLGGTPPQLVDQAVDGYVDMVWTLPAYTAGRFPKTETFELPGVNADPVTTNLALMDFYDRHLQDEYQDLHVLLLHVHAGNAFHSVKPIRTLDDLKGLRVRTPSNIGTIWLTEAGAIPVHRPVPEIPQLLSKSVVDAVMIPFEVAPAFKVAELTDYATTLRDDRRVHTAVFLLAMNKDSYAAMPDDLRAILDANARSNVATFAGEVWAKAERPGQEMAREQGNEFFEIPESDADGLEALNNRVIETWIADNKDRFDGAALVKDAKALVRKHAK